MKIHRIVKTLLLLLLLLVLVVGGYLLYVCLHYYRIPDNTPLEIHGSAEPGLLERGEEYSVLTYNIGFGAYLPTFTFFMDEGYMADGTPMRGEYGKAFDRESVLYSIEGVMSVLEEYKSDFILLQEVDQESDRARDVDQVEMISSEHGKEHTYALYFDTAYLFYPFNDPHGKNISGLLTLSEHDIASAMRRSYPVDESFPAKIFDLDRCFSVHRFPVEGGGELVLVNSHLSAYDEGGVIRKKQLEFLAGFLEEEYEKGNYLIVGGDFNHILSPQLAEVFPSRQLRPDWIGLFQGDELPSFMHLVISDNAFETPTCRDVDIPYEKGVTYTSVVDGFFVSDNIESSALNIDTDFAYSDHNPVRMTFKLL